MPSLVQKLSVLAGAMGIAQAAFGPYFSTGPTASGVYIQQATATLILPDAPSGNTGDLSLWVGMGTSDGDLIQSIADCYVSGSLVPGTEWSPKFLCGVWLQVCPTRYGTGTDILPGMHGQQLVSLHLHAQGN